MPPKAKTKPAAPPGETVKPDDDAVSPVEPDEAAPADGGEEEPAPGEDEAGDEGDDEAPQVGLVTEPCRRCFPDGWPVEEADAFVNCAHGHGIRYGDQVEITRERAVKLGFLDAE